MTDASSEVLEVSDADILLAQRIISASARHDLDALRVMLKDGSANVRDPATGTTPLHAAVASCDTTTESNGASSSKVKEDEALPTVHLLLRNGAIWNDLDKNNETPGCIALRLGLQQIYDVMVDAGVRAELLLTKLEGMFGKDEDVVVEDAEPEPTATDDQPSKRQRIDEESPADIKGVLLSREEDVCFSNDAYLKSELRFRPGILLDSSDNAVMMDWENTIMIRHSETLLPEPGLRALNVGHGLGLVDTAFQARSPKEHHIIEAHPQVLARMRENGWYDKPGVRIWEGRWQDMLPKMVAEGVELDAMYYDTFAEEYSALREFFSEWAIQLLDSNGRLGWYNGLGADRQLCYDVYTKVAEMDLFEAGFDTTWEDIKVPEDLHGSKQWEGTRRPYWQIDVYRLPVNTFIK